MTLKTAHVLLDSTRRGVPIMWTGTSIATGYAETWPATADPTHHRTARAYAAQALTLLLIQQSYQRAREPHPGRTVRSLTTRGKNHGVTGLITLTEVNHYNHMRTELRLRVRLDGTGENRWLEADRCEVTSYGTVDTAAIARHAAHLAASSSWPMLVRLLGLSD